MVIRPATSEDAEPIWRILEPVIRAGETYPLPRDMSRSEALAYWLAPHHEVYVAVVRPPPRPSPLRGKGEEDLATQDENRSSAADPELDPAQKIVGTYYLRANNAGGGAHVANCGYMVAGGATGRGVARAMCAHSLARAKERGFRAMQFNFVIATNERAVRLWQTMGFSVVGRLPGAFLHPTQGYVDALVMYREL
jgi:ribosomal protein S18 acetylase RimI-like enzyme